MFLCRKYIHFLHAFNIDLWCFIVKNKQIICFFCDLVVFFACLYKAIAIE